MARSLLIVSDLIIERYPAPLDAFAVFAIHAPPRRWTMTSATARWLAPFMTPATQEIHGLMPWLRAPDRAPPANRPMDFLLRLTWDHPPAVRVPRPGSGRGAVAGRDAAPAVGRLFATTPG